MCIMYLIRLYHLNILIESDLLNCVTMSALFMALLLCLEVDVGKDDTSLAGVFVLRERGLAAMCVVHR